MSVLLCGLAGGTFLLIGLVTWGAWKWLDQRMNRRTNDLYGLGEE